MHKRPWRRAGLGQVLFGLLWLCGVAVLSVRECRRTLDILALTTRGEKAQGEILEATPPGSEYEPAFLVFRFALPNGRVVTQVRPDHLGYDVRGDQDPPVPTQVRYLPEDPEVSEVEEGLPHKIEPWITQRLLAGAVAVALLVFMGLMMLGQGLDAMRADTQSSSPLRPYPAHATPGEPTSAAPETAETPSLTPAGQAEIEGFLRSLDAAEKPAAAAEAPTTEQPLISYDDNEEEIVAV